MYVLSFLRTRRDRKRICDVKINRKLGAADGVWSAATILTEAHLPCYGHY